MELNKPRMTPGRCPSPSTAAKFDQAPTNAYRAVYHLRRSCHLIDLGMPTIRYEYEFIGYQVVVPATSKVARSWRSRSNALLETHARLVSPAAPVPKGRAQYNLGRQTDYKPAQNAASHGIRIEARL